MVLDLQRDGIQTIGRDDVTGEILTGQRILDRDRPGEAKELREVALPHSFGRDGGVKESMAGDTFAVPKGIKEGLIADDRA